MMCDFGTGNNNKLNWVLEDKQELIDIVSYLCRQLWRRLTWTWNFVAKSGMQIETIYKGARKGRGLVVSPKDYSTRYRY